MAERPMEHFTVDGVNIFEVTDAKARQDVSDLKDDLTAAQVELAKKANTDGYYEEMTVGNAEQLVSTVTNADDTPYNFRTTAGSVDVGDRAYVDAIVGGSVVVNQYCTDPTFTDESKWYHSSAMGVTISNNVAECIASARYASLQNLGIRDAGTLNGHVVGILCDLKADEAYNINIAFSDNVLFTDTQEKAINTSWTTHGMLVKHAEVKKATAYAGINDAHYSGWKKFYVKNYMVFDITATFGTTIADYIYSLETATTGAGVAWLKEHFPKIFNAGYVPYNAGTMVHVSGLSAKKTVGFNQWDEEWESGYINPQTGAETVDSTKIRMKNFVPVLPNTTYYKKSPAAFWNVYFDSDKNYIGYGDASVNTTFTTPNNCRYIRSGFEMIYGTTYNNDICINLHWDGEKDGTYEPYTLHTYAFDPTVELRGVPKLKDGKMYFDGDEYLPDGTVNRRYAEIIFDGSDDETITEGTSGMTFRIYLPSDAIINTDSSEMTNTFATYLTQVTQQSTWGKEWTFSRTANQRSVYFKLADDLTDISTLRTYLAQHPLIFVYELATPTTETAEPYQQTQICDDFGTEEFVSTSPVPVGHNTRYAPNLRAKLEMSPDSPDGDGVYVVQQSNGENTYVSLGSTAVIQDILARLTALEGNTNEG